MKGIIEITLVAMVLAVETTGWGLPVLEDLIEKNEKLEIFTGKSKMLNLRSPAERVSVVEPGTADVQILEPQQIMVSGRNVGETSLVIWMQDGSTRTLDVSVQWNIEQIETVLNVVMPNEPIEVISLDQGIALKGSVSSIGLAEQAVEIAKSFSPSVINLMEVPGLNQVLLKVKIAEVARSFGDEFGIDMRFNNDSVFAGSLMGDVITGELDGGEVNVSDAATMLFGFPNANFDAFFRALQEKGLLYIMAEPNLVARSGETASFLSGGEFPIPIVQDGINQSITIEYKEFGVKLEFTPTVTAPTTVQMDISPEVSDLDFSRGVTISGFTVPIITTRRASTSVKLDHGQTFAIAGLIDTKKQHTNRKIPYVGSIPVFGNLFRSKNLSEVETELLIMVTPYLIAPSDSQEEFTMPTEVYDHEKALKELQKETKKEQKPLPEPTKTQTVNPVNVSSHTLPQPKVKQLQTHSENRKKNGNQREQEWMDPGQFEGGGVYSTKAK